MNLLLLRKLYRDDGIFSDLMDESGNLLAVTLEHAYQKEPGLYLPKVPMGVYTCKRGPHRLKWHEEPFETFEVMGVPNHSGILFHTGNVNADSEGCILIGSAIQSARGEAMIVHSRKTFARLMLLWAGLDEFALRVTG